MKTPKQIPNSRKPVNFFLRKSPRTGVKQVFIKPRAQVREPTVKTLRKSLAQKLFAAHLTQLRKPIKVKLTPVPKRKQGELFSVWKKRNAPALEKNYALLHYARITTQQNTAKAIVAEHIKEVITKNPHIAIEDLKLEILKRVEQIDEVRTSLSRHLLSPNAILHEYRELVKKGLIKEIK